MELNVIGLTGGIASGKSTVAARMKELGLPVIDADRVARQVVEPGQPALQAIREHFGEGVIREDGTLDRAGLGAIVFGSPEELDVLNRITHPAILRSVAAQLAEYQKAGEPIVIYEAALIIENRLAPWLSELIAVVAEPEQQLARLMARNDLDEDAARARIAAQTDNETRLQQASIVIENRSTLEDLTARTDDVVDFLRSRYAG